MARRLITVALALLLTAGCAADDGPMASEPAPAPADGGGDSPEGTTPTTTATTTEAPPGPVPLELSVVASGLEVPWGVAFAPDGSALVTERDSGRLLRLRDGTTEEVQRLPEEGQGEGGLMGLALSPDHATDGLVYAYYSTADDNRVVRFRLGEPPEPVLTGIPVAAIHNGGRLAFGPDGLLYVATGDAGVPDRAQDRGSLGGKILRVAPDGGVPPDNPFPGSPVWSLGHRNVQGLAWDAEGRLYATEFGARSADEVNLIEPGGNYGWPLVEGAGGGDGFIDPLVTFRPAGASPSGAAILQGSAIPQWEGDLVTANLRGERLWRLDLAPDGTVAGQEALLEDEAGRLRTVAQAPDGALWVLTSNRDGRGNPVKDDDRVLRLGPPS